MAGILTVCKKKTNCVGFGGMNCAINIYKSKHHAGMCNLVTILLSKEDADIFPYTSEMNFIKIITLYWLFNHKSL